MAFVVEASVRLVAGELAVATNTAQRALKTLRSAEVIEPAQTRGAGGRFGATAYRLHLPADLQRALQPSPKPSRQPPSLIEARRRSSRRAARPRPFGLKESRPVSPPQMREPGESRQVPAGGPSGSSVWSGTGSGGGDVAGETLHAVSAAATAAYYTRYLTEAPGEQPGVWSGRQATGLGLAGEVSGDAVGVAVVGP